ncbi:MAG: hypothetical protein Fues2KO_36120 [Fuerstiella sp.]
MPEEGRPDSLREVFGIEAIANAAVHASTDRPQNVAAIFFDDGLACLIVTIPHPRQQLTEPFALD